MSQNCLRRTRPVEGDSELLFSEFPENDITISSIESRTVTPHCDDYPFSDQTIYEGTLFYEKSFEYGPDRSISSDFEFRSGSSIFILKSDVDLPVRSIINELNSLSPTRFQIYRNLTPNREDLWGFFGNADAVLEIAVVHEVGSIMDYSELDGSFEQMSRKYPIESATAIFNYRERKIVARYSDGSIQIDSDDPEANEYITQLFERDVVYKS